MTRAAERATAVLAIALWGIAAALVSMFAYSASYPALMFGVIVPGLCIALYAASAAGIGSESVADDLTMRQTQTSDDGGIDAE